MRLRLTPSFLVAVLALVVASSGVGYAAGKISSRQIKNNSILGVDIRNGSLTAADLGTNSVTGAELRNGSVTGTDLANGTVPRTKLDKNCARNEAEVFGGCVRLAATGPTSHQAAIDDCNRRNGRLPSIQELKWIATHDEYTWANGNADNYEFTGDSTTGSVLTPIGFNRAGNIIIYDSSAQFFWHHCVTY